MRIHILGIGGTFMGGLALLAQARGFVVTGSDQAVYPPMSDQLAASGIDVTEGYAHLPTPRPDLVVIGNVLSRGNPAVERVLDEGIPYTSGPAFLAEHVLAGQFVIAVAGTHGKTTVTSLIAWILDQAGLDPGFLIGGIAADFGVSARLGAGRFFVVEADEYDTAFFDKRPKFIHYHPRTLVLNNLEYDHADIYPDLAAIEREFAFLLRTVPASGRVLVNAQEPALQRVLGRGLWSETETFADPDGWWAEPLRADFSHFRVHWQDTFQGEVRQGLAGRHNMHNALAAIAACRHAGTSVAVAVEALGRFAGVRRRLEIRGVVRGITVYDDFAHHPTAIATTIQGLRGRIGGARLVAVLEPRSNTMRMGVHRQTLAASLAGADSVFVYAPPDIGWDVAASLAGLEDKVVVATSHDALLEALKARLVPGDHVLIMSNGGFGGLHDRLLRML
ncbi:MAG: UDP-N-acetylmuramate:L-alanyl-gamma-D-glutamyl-meso-diaminopimelate ligase [Gammaproteobacteria bacterium]|nr:UDP-N-acetylmuramate:L-alanyl-gamma-D-glutamyl-meso-diaminopimelate ligase [Gammaproteobacteria bacterium]